MKPKSFEPSAAMCFGNIRCSSIDTSDMDSFLLLVALFHAITIQTSIEVNLHLLLLACKAESLDAIGCVQHYGIRGVLLDDP